MTYYTIQELREHGVEVPSTDGVHVDRSVRLERIAREGVRLYPGVRVEGVETLLAPGAWVGTHGPVVLKNVVLGHNSRVSSGSAESCVLLDRAILGPDSHVRSGTLLEEDVSTAHAVGLKQTILLAFATLGSEINFCDCLLSGGRSRTDHSEVGSGFIHFNFTPFGASGDKATASLFGDVINGVFLDQDRIFLGGAGGVVGPVKIGFGTVLAAGSVYRRDYGPGLLVVGEESRPRAVPFDFKIPRRVNEKLERTKSYVRELLALMTWYRGVRLRRTEDPWRHMVLEQAVCTLRAAVDERIQQADKLVAAQSNSDDTVRRTWSVATRDMIDALESAPHVLPFGFTPGDDHIHFVRTLPEDHRTRLQSWMCDHLPRS